MKYVPKPISRAVGRTVLRTKVHSPTILFVAGVVGMGTTVVLACRATLKVENVLVEHEKELAEIGRLEKNQSLSLDRDRQAVTFKTTGKLLKIYAPTAVAGVVTISCLTLSHRQLTQRNTALTAAYVGLQKFLDDYRGRVREKVGESEEKDIYYASTPVELVQDTENGPQKVFGSAPTGSSPYSCVFDDTKRGLWQESYPFNENIIRIKQQILTDKLRAQGYLFLNDVYSVFDVEHTYIGQLAGWFVGHPDSDDYVDISITQLHDGRGSLLLDFNVAGDVAYMLGDGNSTDAGFRRKILGRKKT